LNKAKDERMLIAHSLDEKDIKGLIITTDGMVLTSSLSYETLKTRCKITIPMLTIVSGLRGQISINVLELSMITSTETIDSNYRRKDLRNEDKDLLNVINFTEDEDIKAFIILKNNKGILPSNFKNSTLINRVNRANNEAFGMEDIDDEEIEN